jgi:DNA-binding transcriptional ArsR family regulator
MVQQKTGEQVALFSALADPTRLRLVRLLCQQQDTDALCVNALADLLGVTQSAVSQHLRVLKAIGLVKGERRGYHIHYSINPEAVKRCQNMMSAALSIGEPAEQNACKNCNKGRKQNVS